MENARGVSHSATKSYLDMMRRLDMAERRCAKRKRSRLDAMAFAAARHESLHALAMELLQGSWRPAAGSVFVTTRPKHREVHAARYRDRVVHHLIIDALAPALERRMSGASYACRPGKGTLAAVRAVQAWAWRLTRRGERRAWALQLDVRSFFHEIDRGRLWQQLQAPLAEASSATGLPFDLAATVRAVLDDEPARRARRVGPLAAFEAIPLHKRLAERPVGIGLPIGNLTSQWFANVMLDPLDHFVQRQLSLPAYVRYMDDIVVLHTDRDRLAQAEPAIRAFVAERLGLTLHPARPPRKVSEGIDFCGAMIRPHYLLPRKRATGAWHHRLQQASRPMRPRLSPKNGKPLRLVGFGEVRVPCAAWPLAHAALHDARRAWGSGLGLRHVGGGGYMSARLARRHPWLARLFLRRQGGKLVSRYAPLGCGRLDAHWPPRFASWRAQRAALVKAAGDAVALVQWGRRVRLLRWSDARRVDAARGKKLPHIQRSLAGIWVDRALTKGHRVLLVVEAEADGIAPTRRSAAWLLEPLELAQRWWRRWVGRGLLGHDIAVAAGETKAARRPRAPRRTQPMLPATVEFDAHGQALLPWMKEQP